MGGVNLTTMKIQLNKFSDNLRKVLTDHIATEGISKRELAVKCKIHPLQFNEFLRGKAGLSTKTIDRIGEYLG